MQRYQRRCCRSYMLLALLLLLNQHTQTNVECRQLIAPDAATAKITSQPEEIFSAPSGSDMEMNYDEYPMVVPKRAALLLDRLMVALHHALEKERSGGHHRISQFYANEQQQQQQSNNNKNDEVPPNVASNSNGNGNFQMYSDDDPSSYINMDYDFKDLNSINRATGETLMAKSFQRRANMDGGGDGSGGGGFGGSGLGAIEGVAQLSRKTSMQGDKVGGGVGGIGNGSGGSRQIHAGNRGGRKYWRCYFNAVSCF